MPENCPNLKKEIIIFRYRKHSRSQIRRMQTNLYQDIIIKMANVKNEERVV